jgi:hypothetical protein
VDGEILKVNKDMHFAKVAKVLDRKINGMKGLPIDFTF